jgi:hypothetical protein
MNVLRIQGQTSLQLCSVEDSFPLVRAIGLLTSVNAYLARSAKANGHRDNLVSLALHLLIQVLSCTQIYVFRAVSSLTAC